MAVDELLARGLIVQRYIGRLRLARTFNDETSAVQTPKPMMISCEERNGMTPNCICVETDRAELRFAVDQEGRLLQLGFGARNRSDTVGETAYPTTGNGWVFEPALEVVHADGNRSTDLRVVRWENVDGVTRIELKDTEYPLFVELLFRVVAENDLIEAWTVIRHEEEGQVTLESFASSAPDFGRGDFWLTQFHGDFNEEGKFAEEKLSYGVKVLDSKLGARANRFRAPWFLLSKVGPAREDEGEVYGGSLAWSGSYRFSFEVLPNGALRAVCGINPHASGYHLARGEVFETPKMAWVWSDQGTGALSRKLHRYMRTEVLRDGDVPRAILLNNWEATQFDFDEHKITSLFTGARELGMELFLLDDGWFGRKYPRDSDLQGLGDWVPDAKKLPNGLNALTEAAKANGLRFGLWFEPEMVNPRSELFEEHPDWAIQHPKRPLHLQRNQLVLDLANPTVREFAFGVLDSILTSNPGISYVKWDCNRYITQPGSPYLGKDRQTHLQIDYVRALYEIMDRVAKLHPEVEVMMCSGGGGRVDYGSLRYAHELWPSDMTDPANRIFIQWGFSYFIPALAMSNHVTHTGGRSLKFAFDVAMSGRLGMDLDVDKLSSEDRALAVSAIATYKEIRNTVQLGEQYRLESPYEGPRSALMYVRGANAVVFAYALGDCPAHALRLKGLDSARSYRVREINVSASAEPGELVLGGTALMRQGLSMPSYGKYESGVFELTAE